MARARTYLRQVPLPLALLLACAAVLSTAWALSTAPLQGPDEIDHVAYVARLAETGHIPLANSGNRTYAPDQDEALFGLGYQRLLQNRNVRAPTQTLSEQRFRAFEDRLAPGAPGTGEGPLSTAKNPPLYYAYEAIGWRLTPGGHYFGRLFMLRAFSGLALLAMVIFAWLMAGEVFLGRRLPQTVAAGVPALLPMTGYMSGIVNSDILLAAIFTAFGWLALRTVRLGPTWPRAAALTLVAVAAVLTHGRGLAIVPPLAVALVVAWLVHAKSLRATLTAAGASLAVAVAGFVVLRASQSSSGGGASVYGGELSAHTTGSFSVRELLSNIWQFYLPRLHEQIPRPGPSYGWRQMIIEQYLAGVFGSFEVFFPAWVYDTMQVAVAAIIVLAWTLGAVHWRALVARWPVVVVLAATVGAIMLFLHIVSYRALLDTSGANPLLAGRYALPLTAFIGVTIGAVVAALPRRLGYALATLVLVGLVALSVGGLGLNVERFYA
jgi:hypothetical protein